MVWRDCSLGPLWAVKKAHVRLYLSQFLNDKKRISRTPQLWIFAASLAPCRSVGKSPRPERNFQVMTRNTAESSKNLYFWGDNGMHIADGNELLSGTDTECPRPKGRIRRSMTACNTCRKLKTRCDLDPRIHACRRCVSLRLVGYFRSPSLTVSGESNCCNLLHNVRTEVNPRRIPQAQL